MLLRKANYIRQRQGLFALARQAFWFLVRSIFDHQTYYVWENTEGSMTHFLPRVEDFAIKIISTPEELDQLLAEGFDISPYLALHFDLTIEEIKRTISKGAILFCAFVHRELANVNWIGFTGEAKRDIDAVPFIIDFETEACVGGAETMPKYRHLGFYACTCSMLCQFASELGLKSKFCTSKNNIASIKTNPKIGYRIYGEVSYWKFLKWKFWREKPVRPGQISVQELTNYK